MKKSFTSRSILLCIFIFSLFSTFSYAENELNVINSSWSTVLPGKVIAQPQLTSTGFAVITDSKNVMSFTTDGRLICEKYLSRVTNPVFTILPKDLMAVFTNYGRRLNLLNPDGKELWHYDFEDKITLSPFPGRDGRLFIRAPEKLFCFGITGTKKWQIDTPEQSSLDIQELPDGSIVLFLEKTVDQKSKAYRISPFGEVLEDITFAGIISTTLTTPKGILLTFNDGTCGLFSLTDGLATHKWLLKKDQAHKTNRDFFILSQDKENIVYINHKTSSTIEVDYINLEDGNIDKSFLIQNVGQIIHAAYNKNGIFIADSDNAYFYNNLGRFIWTGKLPSKNSKENFNYLTFTNDNYFIIFGTNWTVNGFKTTHAAIEQEPKKEITKDIKYSQYYKTDITYFNSLFKNKLPDSITSEERYNELVNGDYGKKEKDYTTELLNLCVAYQNSLTSSDFGTRVDKNVFEIDSVGLEKALKLFSLYGTDTFNDYMVLFLRNSKSKTYTRTILNGIKQNGYDPDGKLLATMEYLANNISAKDEQLLCDICDATASICTYMGYNAFETKGKAILSNFLYPKYNSKTRTYARTTLKKLIN